MGSQSKRLPEAVSKRMLIVIVLMLVVIVVPVTVLGQPTSKIVVTITNVDEQNYAYVYFRMWGVVDEFDTFFIDPQEVIVFEYRVAIGDYHISIESWSQNQSDFQGVTRSGSVSLFETEEVMLTLGLW